VPGAPPTMPPFNPLKQIVYLFSVKRWAFCNFYVVSGWVRIPNPKGSNLKLISKYEFNPIWIGQRIWAPVFWFAFGWLHKCFNLLSTFLYFFWSLFILQAFTVAWLRFLGFFFGYCQLWAAQGLPLGKCLGS
jgi:hypothetical protein